MWAGRIEGLNWGCIADAMESLCRWVTITTLVQNMQYHLTQGEAPPHVEERETPNRDMFSLKWVRRVDIKALSESSEGCV
jgi:hypothetical protein